MLSAESAHRVIKVNLFMPMSRCQAYTEQIFVTASNNSSRINEIHQSICPRQTFKSFNVKLLQFECADF